MRLEDQEPAENIDDDAEENNALLSDMGRLRAREGDS
jgi:hypothetical protein